jgi:phospholipid transport system substrate-binding protein
MRWNVAWCFMAGGMVIALTGCGFMETSPKSPTAGNYDRLDQHQAMAVFVSGVVNQIEYSPTDAVKNTVADFLSILGNEALKQPDRSVERRHLVEEIIRHHVNYPDVAQRALGLPWKRLTDTERQEFVSLVLQLLRDAFANKIDQYYDEQMMYLSERRTGRFAEVRTNLVGSKVNTSLDFRLGIQSGHWLIYDVVIDGASLVSNYQAQFNRIIRDDSYAGLIEKMKQRNRLVKVFEKTAPDVALSAIQTAPQ